MHRLACYILSHRCLLLLSCLFIWFSACCLDWVISIILSSMSLIHYSALFILLFIIFISVWIYANEFSHFSWLLPILSKAFLREYVLLFVSSLNSLIFSLNSFSIFTISLWNSMSDRLQRSVSLFAASCELFCSFNWECFWASSSCLCFSISVSLGKPNCSLGGLLLCKSTPLYFVGGYYLFLVWEFEHLLSLSLAWAGCYPRVLSVFPGRRRQWVGLVVSAWLPGS